MQTNKGQLYYDFGQGIDNTKVYDFLVAECKQDADLWAEFGEGILSHTDDGEFRELLSERLDCFRICEDLRLLPLNLKNCYY